MATTNNLSGDPTTEPAETAGPDNETASTATETETAQVEQEEASTDAATPQKPADPAKASLLADLYKERTDRKAAQAELQTLKEQVSTLTASQETLDAVQRKYDRLEAFLAAVGGPLGKALDSKSFTSSLFETDEDIATLVAEWNKANPSTTSSALSSSSAAPSSSAPDVNALLRAAARK